MSKLDDFMARGVVTLADGEKKMRVVQVRLLADEVRDDLEHVEPYGFTSEPLPEAEAFALFFGGDRSHGVVFCVADRRYRLKPLKCGEVAIYDDLGQKVHLTRSGIEIETPKTLTATVGQGATVKAASVLIDSPTSTFTGDVTIQKTLSVSQKITGSGGLAVSGGDGATVSGDVVADGISLKSHVHTEQGDGADTSTPK